MSAAPSAAESQVASAVADILTQRGYLFELKASAWSGRARLTEDDLGLSGLTSEQLHRLGHRQLVPRESIQAITAIVTRARVRLTQVSYEFPLGSSRFVPTPVLGALMADLNRIREEFYAAVRKFTEEYETTAEAHRAVWRENALKIQAERNLSAEWLEQFEINLAGCYPAKAEVADKFTMSWGLFQFALPKGVQAQLVSHEQAIEAARLADEARRQVEAQVRGFVGEAALELRKRAGELCAHVARQVRESGEKVTERSLQPLRDLIAQFRSMDFTGDTAFAQQLEAFAAQHLTTGTAKSARDSGEFRENLASPLTAMADRAVGESEAAAAEALERFLQFGRAGRAVE